jgi:hypothetical protein
MKESTSFKERFIGLNKQWKVTSERPTAFLSGLILVAALA